MRLRTTLADIASVAATAMAFAGCGGHLTPGASTSPDAAADDAVGPTADAATDYSVGPTADAIEPADAPPADAPPADAPADVSVDAPEDVGCGTSFDAACSVGTTSPSNACALIAQDMPYYASGEVWGPACGAYCDNLCPCVPGGAPTYWLCAIDPSYFNAYQALLEAGTGEGGADAAASCPTWSSQVMIACLTPPIGRRTAGTMEPMSPPGSGVGGELADRAYLEALSVHSFETLERELVAHGAPPSLLRDVRRARRDEVRHAAMTERLARRFGGRPRPFVAPPPAPARGLLAIAIENAVEGCVRETYGAVVGLVEARMSADPGVRRAMRSIAADECRHAELAWAVATWLRRRLAADERALVDRALRDAVEELRRDAEPHILCQLERRVWRRDTRAVA